MSIDTLINLVQTGQWAALALLLLTLLNVWLSDASKFPATAPGWLRPLLVIIAGQAMAVAAAAAAHQPYAMVAVHAGLASVLAIATSHAIWNGNAPGWMKTVAGIVELLESNAGKDDEKK